MKNRVSILIMFIVLSVVLSISVTAGCSDNRPSFDVSGQTTQGVSDSNFITSVEDIENLVTDNDRLVINYFDAYIWVVFFNEESKIESMMYIYEFENDETAQSMTSVRSNELSQNKTMTVIQAYCVANYVVVSLTDTSFQNISRSMLENNFNGLIVY